MFAASKSGSVDAKDPQFNYVTMLLHGDGTNGAQNNTFLDSSTNNFTITRNGNTTQGTFTPYGANWSNYFDGTGDTLNTASNAAFGLGTGSWTLEAFVYPTVAQTDNWIIATNDAGKLRMRVGASGYLSFFTDTGNVSLNSTTVVTVNAWSHVAICYDGTTLSLFQNGTRTATATVSISNGSANACYIGSNTIGGSFWNGYISNARVVKGTAVYSGATYTVPTAPLTAITNTSLLTCADNRFIDDSTNNFTITKSGDVSVQRFSPFSPTTAYSTSVIGGSGYFDGSGDYLTTPQNAAFNIGTGQFTVECFIYWNGTALANGGYGLINLGNGANGGGPFTGWGLILDFDSGGKPTFYRFDGTVYSYQSSTNPTANQWIHLAVSRNSSNTLSIWMNGVRVFTGTVTTSFNNVNSDPLNFGYRQDGGTGGTHYFPGYISNARVVVGTDVYGAANSTITVPTTPLTAITNTSLLLSTTNAGILDNAMMNDLETVGNAQISTSVKKYGTGSMYFDGTGDWLMTPNRTNLNVGSGDFTVEAWVYTGSTSQQVIIGANRNVDGVGAFMLNLNYTGKVRFFCSYSGGTILDYNVGSGTISDSAWHHIAVTRSGSSLRIFIDGTQTGTTNTTLGTASIDNAIADYRVGSTTDGALNFNGYIDDLRITKYARYTATFTAPTTAFADKG
jgi:hypothetical protein